MTDRRELFIYLCLAVMEALAAFVLFEGLGIVSAHPLHGGLVWLLIYAAVVGAIGTLLLQPVDLGDSLKRAARLGIALLACAAPAFITLRSGWAAPMTTLLLVTLYWRGTRATREEPDYADTQWRFGAGLAVLLIGIVILVARGETENGSIWLSLSLAGVAYTIAGLAALGVSRMDTGSDRATGQAVILAIALQLAAVLGLSLLALSIFSFDIAGWLGALLSPLWDGVVGIIVAVAGFLAMPLVLLAEHLRLRSTSRPLKIKRFGPPPQGARRHASPSHDALTHQVVLAAEILAIVLVIAVVLLLVWRVSAHRERRGRKRPATERRERLLSPRQALHAVLAWLRRLVSRGAASTETVMAHARHRVWGPTYPADPIRKVYAQVLYRAARHGLARPPTATPLQFERDLAARWPAGAADFAALTSAYLARRYGDVAPASEDLHRVQEQWHRLRSVIRATS